MEMYYYIMMKYLPKNCDILCTHPMFGPDSAKKYWKNLPFVYEKTRIQNLNNFKEIIHFFKKKECNMIEMSCEEHDKYSANSQFITHLTGRILSKLNLKTTPINTKGFDMLLGLIENTEKDSFELFKGLYKYNNNSILELNNLRYSLDKLGILQTDSVKVTKSPDCIFNSFKSKSPIDSGRVARLCL